MNILFQEPFKYIKETEIKTDMLKIDESEYKRSIEKINNLRDHIDVLRIMIFNVHGWRDANKKFNYSNMIKDIVNVFPDILCVQEDINIDMSNIKYTDEIKLFTENYTKFNFCNADFNLENSIYVKKSILNKCKIYKNFKIGKNINDISAKDRCTTSIIYTMNNKDEIYLYNTHLHHTNVQGYALQNVQQLYNEIEKDKNTDKNFIIMGDFNSYNEKDLKNEDLKNEFKKLKEKHGCISKNGDINCDNMFQVCKYLESKRLNDIYDIYVNFLIYQNSNNNNIPLNTTKFGGRIDHVFLSKNFKHTILGVYKLYTDSSDHSPIIFDILDENSDDYFKNPESYNNDYKLYWYDENNKENELLFNSLHEKKLFYCSYFYTKEKKIKKEIKIQKYIINFYIDKNTSPDLPYSTIQYNSKKFNLFAKSKKIFTEINKDICKDILQQ